METFITVLQVLACLLAITLILLQPSKGGSFFTSSNQGVFGSSGGTTFLFRATMWCAGFLAASCIFLSWLNIRESGQSVVEAVPQTNPIPPVSPVNANSPASAPATTPAPAK